METLRIDSLAQLQPGERGTLDGRRVFYRCDRCGILLDLGRIWAVGQTVNDVKDNGRRPCCSQVNTEAMR